MWGVAQLGGVRYNISGNGIQRAGCSLSLQQDCERKTRVSCSPLNTSNFRGYGQVNEIRGPGGSLSWQCNRSQNLN